MSTAKILAVDDEADFELSLGNASAARSREGGFSFCFTHHGEEALATLAVEADIDLMRDDRLDIAGGRLAGAMLTL